MRHSSENIQQQRPFTTIATTTTSTNNVNRANEKTPNSTNNDTILSLLNNSHSKYSVNNNNHQNLNINRSVSSPITGKGDRRSLSVVSVNALYNDYRGNNYHENTKINASLCEMNRVKSSGKTYNETRKATPIPDLDGSAAAARKELEQSESLMEDLDDIIESPKLTNSRYPKTNETNIWINTSTASDETVAADSGVLMGQKSTDR